MVRRSRNLLNAFAGLALILILSASDSADAKKDDLMNAYAATVIGQSIGESLGGIIETAAQMPKAAAEAEQQIQDARRRFWETYPDKPGFAEADAEFARQLAGKDMYYLWLESVNEGSLADQRRKGRQGTMGAGDVVQMMAGRVIDGGIPCRAQFAFNDWYAAFRGHMFDQSDRGKISNLFALPDMMKKAVAGTRWAYDKYKLQRDWAELDRVQRLPSWVKTPRDYAHMLIIRYWGLHGTMLDAKKAAAIYQEMVEVLGEHHVHAVAEQVRQAPKDECGDIVDVGVLGLAKQKEQELVQGADGHPTRSDKHEPVPAGRAYVYSNRTLDVFQALLATGDVRHYLLGTYYGGSWKGADRLVKSLIAAYGQEPVLQVAAQVQQAPKRMQDGRLFEPAKLGLIGPFYPDVAIKALLARKDPKSFARFLTLADRDGEARNIDTYSELVRVYGEEKLLAMATAIVDKIYWPKGVPGEFCPKRVWEGATRGMGDFHHDDGQVRRLMIEGLWLASSPEDGVDKAGSGDYENLAYDAWMGFAPGARVDGLSSMREGSRKDKLSLFAWRDMPGFEKKNWSYNLDSTDARKVLVSDKRCENCSQETVPHGVSRNWADEAKINQFFPASIARIALEGLDPIRNEVIAVGNKKIAATLYEEGKAGETRKIWISDQIPGGVVKVERWNYFGDLRVQVWERVVISFNGQRVEPASASDHSNSAQEQGRQTVFSVPQFACNFYQ